MVIKKQYPVNFTVSRYNILYMGIISCTSDYILDGLGFNDIKFT